ncbi:MAG: LuxR C-terminal-related transcriptional regulator [Bacteroidota bacterium]
MNPISGMCGGSYFAVMASQPNQYFTRLSHFWHTQPYGDAPVDYSHFVQVHPILEVILSLGPCVTWILDLRTGKYDFMSSNARKILGHEADQWMEQGMDFFNEIMHPADRPYTWKLLSTIWDFLLALPPQHRKHYQFNSDYRIRKADGSYVRVLEQNAVLQQDSQGNITHLLGVCSDITHWKKSEAQIASIMSTVDDTCFCCTSTDESLRPPAQLSKREREIVKLVAEGYNSKYIAEKLSISFHTVNTHRQKMIEKTHSKNASGLVQFAITNGLI